MRWEGVGVCYKTAAGAKWVLKDASGEAAAGEMQALLGPSGAGKSTLLEVLSLRRRPAAGRVAAPRSRRAVAFVAQDGAFPPTLSVLEVVRFHEALLPPPAVARGTAFSGAAGTATAAAVAAGGTRAEAVLRVMGLGAAADTLVGGVLPGGLTLRGLSGGERKRLAIACGVLGRPRVLLLDEPTSGLDSCAARSVMAHVRGMTRQDGQAVVASIHQPAAVLWGMFDAVTLLADGHLLFNGPAPDLAPWLGESLGRTYDPAVHGLPSDWALGLASAFGLGAASGDGGCEGGRSGEAASAEELAAVAGSFKLRQEELRRRQLALLEAASGSDDGSSGSGSSAPAAGAAADPPPRRGFWSQLSTLAHRELLLVTRNPADVAGRTLTFVWVAALVGFCFQGIPDTASGLRARLNILFSSLCFLLLMPFLSTSLLAGGKEAFVRDAGARLYSPAAYYLAKVAATLPFGVLSSACFHLVAYGLTGLRGGAWAAAQSCTLGVLAYLIGAQMLHLAVLLTPHQDSAFMLAIGWTSLQMIFSGFFVVFGELRYSWLAQLRHVSAMYFALEGTAVVEFAGRDFACDASGLTPGAAALLSGLVVNAAGAPALPPAALLAGAMQGGGGCGVRADAVLRYYGFDRSFGGSVGALAAYLGVQHLLSYAAMVLLARRR